MQILDPSQIFFLTSHQIFSFSVPLPSGHIWVNWTCPSAVVYHALRNFFDEHYELYISYQRWYESLLFPLWIIMRGHFYRFCVNDNTYTVRFSEKARRSCCNFQKGCPYPRFHCTVSRCAHLECPRCAHLPTLSLLFTPY